MLALAALGTLSRSIVLHNILQFHTVASRHSKVVSCSFGKQILTYFDKMVEYKLSYFNFRGKGEFIRIIFAYLGIPYEDHRIEMKDWREWKAKYTWGQVPVLEIDGIVLCQSVAIARFLGRKYGLAGVDDFEAAKCDEYVDAINDLGAEWKKFARLDEDKKAEGRKEFLEVHAPKYLNKLSSFKTSNEGSLWLVGFSITWADLFIAAALDSFETRIDANILEPYPVIKALKQRVFSLPKVKEYVEQRPAD